MLLPLRFLQPFFGARIFKTGLSVFLVVVLYHVFGSSYATFGAVAAILAVQPSVTRAKQIFIQQFLGNMVGGGVAALVGLWLGSSPLSMALGVILVLGILPRVGLNDAANLAVVVVLFVLERPGQDFWFYTFERVAAITGGMLIGYLVNRLILPPNYSKKLRQELETVNHSVSRFGEHLIISLRNPGSYEKDQIKEEAATISKELETARYFLDLSQESVPTDPNHLPIKKAVASMFVCLERIMDIHKIVLQAGGLPNGLDHDLVAEALRSVLAYKRDLMGTFLNQATPDPEVAQTYVETHDRLEARIAQLIDIPDQRAMGLALHEVLTNIKHMGWRMESLSRLLLQARK